MREVFEMNQRKIIAQFTRENRFYGLVGRNYFWGWQYVSGSSDLFIYDNTNRISKDEIRFAQEFAETFVSLGGKEIKKPERDRFLERFLK